MWFGLFVEVGLLEGHFPEGCFLCLWKVLIREVELGKEINLIAVQIFGGVRGIITIIPPSCSPCMASLGREQVGRAPQLKEFLHSGADFAGLQPLWDKNSPIIRFILIWPSVDVLQSLLPWL